MTTLKKKKTLLKKKVSSSFPWMSPNIGQQINKGVNDIEQLSKD